MIDPLLAKSLSVAFALLFLVAAWHKFSDRKQFVATLGNYQMLPDIAIQPVAAIIPVAELVLGGLWLFGWFVPATALVSASLLGIYAWALSVNLVRGRVHIDCGCGFGRAAGQSLSWSLVLRNIVLIALVGPVVLPSTGRPLFFADYFVAFVAVLTAVLLVASAEQLIKNRAAINSWRGS